MEHVLFELVNKATHLVTEAFFRETNVRCCDGIWRLPVLPKRLDGREPSHCCKVFICNTCSQILNLNILGQACGFCLGLGLLCFVGGVAGEVCNQELWNLHEFTPVLFGRWSVCFGKREFQTLGLNFQIVKFSKQGDGKNQPNYLRGCVFFLLRLHHAGFCQCKDKPFMALQTTICQDIPLCQKQDW